jgi:hypothetical protein
LAISLAHELGLPLSAAALAVSTAALPPVAAAGSKPVVRTVITLTLSALCTWRSRCRRRSGARRCRALSTLVMSLICADVQLGGHARGDVLAAGGGREQDVAVVAGDRQHLRGHVLGQAVLEAARRRRGSPWRRRRSGSGLGRLRGIGAGHQHVDVAAAGSAAVTVLRVAA